MYFLIRKYKMKASYYCNAVNFNANKHVKMLRKRNFLKQLYFKVNGKGSSFKNSMISLPTDTATCRGKEQYMGDW